MAADNPNPPTHRHPVTEHLDACASASSLIGGGWWWVSMPLVVPGCRETPPKRLAAKKVHLTYAALYEDEL